MIDLLYLAHNRLEFTKASMAALIQNTNWDKVERLLIYDDDSTDRTRDYLKEQQYPVASELHSGRYGSPVAIMNDYLCTHDPTHSRVFAKIDSDTMVPEGWLDECWQLLTLNSELDLLGIEAIVPGPAIPSGRGGRRYEPARHIGGIGVMRSGAFVTLPRPNGRFGFTAWQEHSPCVKGWIDPALPVFLLDRLPREPWQTLSAEYVVKGWQRAWSPYTEDCKSLWSWWCA